MGVEGHTRIKTVGRATQIPVACSGVTPTFYGVSTDKWGDVGFLSRVIISFSEARSQVAEGKTGVDLETSVFPFSLPFPLSISFSFLSSFSLLFFPLSLQPLLHHRILRKYRTWMERR